MFISKEAQDFLDNNQIQELKELSIKKLLSTESFYELENIKNALNNKNINNDDPALLPARCVVSENIMASGEGEEAILRQPVVINSGHIFSQAGIQEWLEKNDTCPITRKKVEKKFIELPLLKQYLREIYISNLLQQAKNPEGKGLEDTLAMAPQDEKPKVKHFPVKKDSSYDPKLFNAEKISPQADKMLLEVDSSAWLKNQSDKEGLVKEIENIYEHQLAGKRFGEQTIEQAIQTMIEKQITRAVAIALSDHNDVEVLCVGKNFNVPTKDGSYIYPEEKYGSLSRLDGLIAHDTKSRAMVLFHFGFNHCEIVHSASQFNKTNNKEKVQEYDSCQLATHLLDKVKIILKESEYKLAIDNNDIHRKNSENSVNNTQKASNDKIQDLFKQDEVTVKTMRNSDGTVSVGMLPLISEERAIGLTFGGVAHFYFNEGRILFNPVNFNKSEIKNKEEYPNAAKKPKFG